MVTVKKKGCCGDDQIKYYYCDICGSPYGSMKEAVTCESSHFKEKKK